MDLNKRIKELEAEVESLRRIKELEDEIRRLKKTAPDIIPWYPYVPYRPWHTDTAPTVIWKYYPDYGTTGTGTYSE